jgi:ribosomal protein S1
MKNNLERYVGQSIPLKVIEVDKERRKVVLSNKLAADEDRQSKKAETVANLQNGQIRRGVVRRLTNYGAFVDLGGIDGLLHISEMSWTRINHPSEVLKEGQELDVVILKLDLDQGRISLGLRQILPDPWTGIDQRYHVGDTITGQVSRIVPFGAFVQVEGGIEGIIPNSELSGRRGQKAPALQQGDEVEVKVIDVRPDERKMTLSLRQARQEQETRREREVVETYQASTPEREEPRFTIGDAFRAQQQAQAESEEGSQPEPVSEPEPVTTSEGAAENELEAELQTTEPGEEGKAPEE